MRKKVVGFSFFYSAIQRKRQLAVYAGFATAGGSKKE